MTSFVAEKKVIRMRVSILLLILSVYSALAWSLPRQETTWAADSTSKQTIEAPDRFQPKHLILPASLITLGAVGTAVDGMQDFHLFSRRDSVTPIRIDNYLEWGMLGWVFLCDLMGKEKHRWTDQLFLVALAEGLNAGMVQGLKHTLHTTRPDGSPHSFPSGHTANAFLGAHIAYKEFRDTSPVLAYSGYAVALFVAGSRLHNNRHWVADVVAGAGFGILSVELSYLIYFPIRDALMRKADDRLVVAPLVNGRGAGVFLSLRF